MVRVCGDDLREAIARVERSILRDEERRLVRVRVRARARAGVRVRVRVRVVRVRVRVRIRVIKVGCRHCVATPCPGSARSTWTT